MYEKTTTKVVDRWHVSLRIFYDFLLLRVHQPSSEPLDPSERPDTTNLYWNIFLSPCQEDGELSQALLLTEIAWCIYGAVNALLGENAAPLPFLGYAVDAPKERIHSKVYNLLSLGAAVRKDP